MRFGQVVVGPPGSGKTSYCGAMSTLLRGFGKKVAVVNLDPLPSLESLPFEVDVDIRGLINTKDMMETLGIGPKSALIHCMEFLEINLSWLKAELDRFSDCYILFDCPGQVEIYTEHSIMRKVVEELQNADFSLVAVHLVDSSLCSDPGNFVSVLQASLSAMKQFEMTHVKALSKVDMISNFGKMLMCSEVYRKNFNMAQLLKFLPDELTDDTIYKSMVSLEKNYRLVPFLFFNIYHQKSMLRVLRAANQANGYIFDENEGNRDIQSLLSVAVGTNFEDNEIAEVRESLSTLEVADFCEKEQFAKPPKPNEKKAIKSTKSSKTIGNRSSAKAGKKVEKLDVEEKDPKLEDKDEDREWFTVIPG